MLNTVSQQTTGQYSVLAGSDRRCYPCITLPGCFYALLQNVLQHVYAHAGGPVMSCSQALPGRLITPDCYNELVNCKADVVHYRHTQRYRSDLASISNAQVANIAVQLHALSLHCSLYNPLQGGRLPSLSKSWGYDLVMIKIAVLRQQCCFPAISDTLICQRRNVHMQLPYDLKQISLTKNEQKEVDSHQLTLHSAAIPLNGDDWTQNNERL